MSEGSVGGGRSRADEGRYLNRIVGSRNGGGMGCFMVVACLATAAPGVYFLVVGIRSADPLGYLMAAFMLSGAVLLGPYALFVHRTYFIGLRDDDRLVMRSVVAFVPRWTEVDMRLVREVRRLPSSGAYTVEFVDEQDRRLALFNAGIAPDGLWLRLLDQLVDRYPDVWVGPQD